MPPVDSLCFCDFIALGILVEVVVEVFEFILESIVFRNPLTVQSIEELS